MELKTNYSYSYFIYPYIIKENKYKKYILKLVSDKKCNIKFYNVQKDVEIYNFFLPQIKEYMFSTFGFMGRDLRSFNMLNTKLKANILSSYPCVMFEYNLGKDIQAKAGEENGIFFKIQKIELICFKTGICFLCMKTNVEDSNNFSDILNFNYKFRDINNNLKQKNNENIRIQTDTFQDVKKISELIRNLTWSNINYTGKIDLDTNRFFTYSYACIDQEYWKEEKDFDKIKKEFSKYANVLTSEFNSNFENENLKIANLGKYIKIGVNNLACNLLTSTVNAVNYTTLPYKHENQYLYTYIISLYKKIYLKKILRDFRRESTILKANKEFIEFTNDVWIHEITNNDNGKLIDENLTEVLDLEKLYEMTKREYDIAYKELNISKNLKTNNIILIALIISMIINIMTFMAIIRK